MTMIKKITFLGVLLHAVVIGYGQPSVTDFNWVVKQDTCAPIGFTYTTGGKTIVGQGIYYRGYSAPFSSNVYVLSSKIATQDTVMISPLQPATRYKYGVYIIWDNNGSNDTVFSSTEKDFYSLATEPTTHVGYISISAATTNSVTLSYSASSGATRYAIYLNSGDSPIDVTLIQDGIAISNPPNNLGIDRKETTATSYQWLTLSQNQTYTSTVVPMNRSGLLVATNNFLTSGNVSSITFRLAPTTQASNISLDNFSGGVATISWTNGNGNGRVVKMNTSNSFTDPTLGTYPTANPVWQNAGEQVIYTGSASTVQISGLSSGQTYWFRIYELNNPESGRALYNTSTSTNNPASFTPIGEPITQDYTITFSGITADQIIASWTKGDGEKRIVKVNTQNSFTLPVDNTTYSANSVYGGGEQVVYNGTGNTVTVTNLASGTTYYFRVFAYNGSPGEEKYNTQTSSQNPNYSATPGVTPTTQDNNIVFSNITDSTFTITWTKGNGQYRLVAINDNPITTLPTDGNVYTADSIWQKNGQQYVYNDTGNKVTVKGLTPGTLYYVRIFGYNGLLNPSYLRTIATGNPTNTTTPGFIYWTGSVSSNWDNASNWNPNVIPGASYKVRIPQVMTNYPTINQNTSCYQITLEPLAQFTVETGVQFNVSTDFTIMGNSSGSGSLVVKGNGSVSVGQNTKFVRHTGSNNYWHFASAPTNNPDIKQFTGHYVNRWNETTQSWSNLNLSSKIDVMRGYSIRQYNRDTAVFTGTFNNGNISLEVTNSDFGEYPGLNIVGNPYPSAIDWNTSSGWTRSNIEPTIYVYHTQSQSYYTYNYQTQVASPATFDGVVPAGNGFYIIAETNTTIAVSNNVRVHSNQPFYKESRPDSYPTLRLSLANKDYSDELVVYFHPEAGKTLEYNGRFDAVKLFPLEVKKPLIYAKNPGQFNKRAVLALNPEVLDNLPDNGTLDIPIQIEVPERMVANLIPTATSLPKGISMYLIEPFSKKWIPLNEPVQDIVAGEYLLRFATNNYTPLAVNEMLTPEDMLVYVSDGKLYVSNNQNVSGELLISDILGRVVFHGTFFENETKIIDVKQNQSIFVISFRTKDWIKALKYFKQ